MGDEVKIEETKTLATTEGGTAAETGAEGETTEEETPAGDEKTEGETE